MTVPPRSGEPRHEDVERGQKLKEKDRRVTDSSTQKDLTLIQLKTFHLHTCVSVCLKRRETRPPCAPTDLDGGIWCSMVSRSTSEG